MYYISNVRKMPNEALKKTGFTRKTPTSSPEQKRRSSARRAALGEQKVRSQI